MNSRQTPPHKTDTHRHTRQRRLRSVLLCVAFLVTAALAACSPSQEVLQDRFCTKLKTYTGLTGAESTLVAGDPARLATLTTELEELEATAPVTIKPAVAEILDFFTEFQKLERDKRRELLIQRQTDLEFASATLDRFALEECGLFLQRAIPTPTPHPQESD